MRNMFLGVIITLMALLFVGEAQAISWQTSCGVDRGAISRKSGSYVFRPSANHCPGGIFHQRAELNTGDISVSQQATYVFESTISMKTAASEEFVVFQIHDARDGCAPPMSLRWTSNNRFRFDSDYTRGQGMAGCVENSALRGARYRGPSLNRDGTAYHLQVQLQFDGLGAFNVFVFIDGSSVLSGTYQPSDNSSFVASKRFFMKHGVYSQDMFEYEMTSTGMRAYKL